MRCVFALICVGISLVPATLLSQTPEIDNNRWTGNTAQSQAQGFSQGDPLRLTWGFLSEGTSIPSFGRGATANSNLIARLDTIYGTSGGSDLTQRSWFSQFESTFNRWASISGLSYTYEANDDGANFVNAGGVLGVRADVRMGGRNIDGNSGILAFNFFPNTGDMVIDTNDSFFANLSNNSRGLRNVLAHEHGHGLGMPHLFANNSSQLMEPFINNSFDGPQFHDILVAQRAYGDVNEKSFNQAGNDVAARATDLGIILNQGTVTVGDSARSLAVAATANDFFSIDDASDIDFWSFSIAEAGSVDITLESLGFTYNTQPQGNDGNPTGTNVAFNTRNRSDLALSLFDIDGSTLLFSSNVAGLGGIESITDFDLFSAGTYFVRVTGVDNTDASSLDIQFYGLSVSFTSAIPEPSSLLVLAGMATALGLRRRR